MNIKQVNALIKDLQENLGDACIASAIISYDSGSNIASYKVDEKASALLSKYTTFLDDMLKKAGVGAEIEYYAINMPDNLMAFTLMFKGYCWFTIVNVSVVPLGMIMNGVLPECIEDFQITIA